VLTRAGWILAIAGLAAGVAGRILATTELTLVGVALIGVTAAALIRAWFRRPNLVIDRKIVPPRVHVGDGAQVEVSVSNRANRPSPVVRLTDQIADRRPTSLGVAPLAPGANRSAGYRLATDHRGRIEIGPLSGDIEDPLGLTRRSWDAGGLVELRVLPRVTQLQEVDAIASVGANPSGSTRPGTGGDFHALRPYVPGDDLRLMHWSATARLDEPVIRQYSDPVRDRLLVIADVRTAHNGDESFEALLSAFASVLVSVGHGEVEVGAMRSDQAAVTWLASDAQRVGALDELADIQPTEHEIDRVFREVSTEQGRGTGVVVLTRRAGHVGGSLTRMCRGAPGVRIAVFRGPDTAPSDEPGIMELGPGAQFGPAWTALSTGS